MQYIQPLFQSTLSTVTQNLCFLELLLDSVALELYCYWKSIKNILRKLCNTWFLERLWSDKKANHQRTMKREFSYSNNFYFNSFQLNAFLNFKIYFLWSPTSNFVRCLALLPSLNLRNLCFLSPLDGKLLEIWKISSYLLINDFFSLNRDWANLYWIVGCLLSNRFLLSLFPIWILLMSLELLLCSHRTWGKLMPPQQQA